MIRLVAVQSCFCGSCGPFTDEWSSHSSSACSMDGVRYPAAGRIAPHSKTHRLFEVSALDRLGCEEGFFGLACLTHSNTRSIDTNRRAIVPSRGITNPVLFVLTHANSSDPLADAPLVRVGVTIFHANSFGPSTDVLSSNAHLQVLPPRSGTAEPPPFRCISSHTLRIRTSRSTAFVMDRIASALWSWRFHFHRRFVESILILLPEGGWTCRSRTSGLGRLGRVGIRSFVDCG